MILFHKFYAQEAKTLLENLIDLALQKHATDIHISSDNNVSLRVGGEIEKISFDANSPENFWQEVTSNFREELKEKDFAYTTSNGTRLRCNYYLASGKRSIAIRILPRAVASIRELSLPPVFAKIANEGHGLILICGDVGSGKSTTMAAMIEEINNIRPCHIVTIEDPIEYVFASKKSLVHQREIGTDTEDFARATVASLRQDADVIMIGEIRDEATAEAALVAAESGRLVFATLHSSSATGAAERFAELSRNKLETKNRLARAFVAIIYQKMFFDEARNPHAGTELLLHTKATENCIIDSKESALRDAMQSGKEFGMFTLDDDLARLSAKFGKLTGKI